MAEFEDARDELYGLDPDEFMTRRNELAAAARSSGDALAAKQISSLRKPTRSAYAVNLLVRAQPDTADRLEQIGDELRTAQQQLDGAAMRELSHQRNKLVDELARAALKAAGKGATASLRDEIAGTVGAAIADPDILERLREGALVRAERWDGIGVVGAPNLRLVQGLKKERPAGAGTKPGGNGGDKPTSAREDDGETVTARSASDERARARRQEKVDTAQAVVTEAEQTLDAASDAVATRRREVRRLEDQLDDARRRLDESEHELRRAREHVDKARAALDQLT